MVSQRWGYEGCTGWGIPLCRFNISLAVADTWILPAKSRARTELGRQRWWNCLTRLLFGSAKQDRLFCSAATVRYPTKKARFWKALCREWFINWAKAKGKVGPGVHDQGWELGMETWAGKTHPLLKTPEPISPSYCWVFNRGCFTGWMHFLTVYYSAFAM